MNSFTKPNFKKTYYISRTHKPIISNIIDCSIKNITKLNNDKGYTISAYINNEDKEIFQGVDNMAIQNLVSNNNEWFNNNLSEDDIINLFRYSVCEQTNCINIIMNYNTKLYINNKTCEIQDFISRDMSYFRKCMINIKIQHMGLYIYAKHTFNRWYIDSIHLYEEDIESENKEDIEETWNDLVMEAINKLNHKIQNIEDTKTKINVLYQYIQKNHRNREWDVKIQELKKIIQNIIF